MLGGDCAFVETEVQSEIHAHINGLIAVGNPHKGLGSPAVARFRGVDIHALPQILRTLQLQRIGNISFGKGEV